MIGISEEPCSGIPDGRSPKLHGVSHKQNSGGVRFTSKLHCDVLVYFSQIIRASHRPIDVGENKVVHSFDESVSSLGTASNTRRPISKVKDLKSAHYAAADTIIAGMAATSLVRWRRASCTIDSQSHYHSPSQSWKLTRPS
jgi:hypothetical protein